MDPRRFDGLVRALPSGTRRGLLAALAGGVLASPIAAGTKAKKRKKKARLRRNAFGCVDVGNACLGNNANCCSGVCAGKKPKKGKRDTSRCVAHDESTCLAGQTLEICGGAANIGCTTTLGAPGQCVTTTGKAPFCFAGGGACFRCSKDTDCIPLCGQAAACVVCSGECAQTGGATCVGQGFCNNP